MNVFISRDYISMDEKLISLFIIIFRNLCAETFKTGKYLLLKFNFVVHIGTNWQTEKAKIKMI